MANMEETSCQIVTTFDIFLGSTEASLHQSHLSSWSCDLDSWSNPLFLRPKRELQKKGQEFVEVRGTGFPSEH